jgi:L-ascorbate metabolism protein UlaG (beta-lactamase superfamily)
VTVRVTFYGHACFGFEAEGVRLLLDPYEPGTLGGAVTLPALPDAFDAVITTHDHVDHAAVHTVPSAVLLQQSGAFGPFAFTRYTAFHDEHHGRLRGGTTDLVRVTVHGRTILHAGDIGERPTGPLLAWMRAVPVDVLLLPVGGYFTIGPHAARELARLIGARYTVPCHSADDGVALPQLAPRSAFYAGAAQATQDAIVLHEGDALARAVEPKFVCLRRS